MNSIKTLSVFLTMAVAFPVFAQATGEVPPASLGEDVPRATSVQPSQTTQPAPEPISRKRPPRVHSSAPPAEITVRPGRNTTFSVALFHVNRIVTPFRSPEIRTSSTATLTIENGIVYVTTQTEDPIGLFVFEKSDPTQAISLTLNPDELAPVSVTVNLEGHTAQSEHYMVSGDPTLARTWETADPYVETVTALFKELALGKIPDGFGMMPVAESYPHTPICNQYGMHVQPMQLIEGARVTTVVARVTNVTHQPLEVNESECASGRMVGAAVWPKTLLNPGESAELYLAIKTPESSSDASLRPSVLDVGRAR